ncbi:Aste57867_1515 [Aphanomyces stellatus]|uniref:Aste57867_1515 protein n=1 Tax=Aphanomyces stellatus TaxID=120398 RepID=A0A485K6M7_9STRA|nr:hypothetical protein As57867_001514 [Aphanomyces stellatus]VFT78731.1 Aste57867_1515 [Aphanomyces stellatus]
MLHRSSRGWSHATRTWQTQLGRCMSSMRPNGEPGSIERAVADATAALMLRLQEVEAENAQLKRALQEATKSFPTIDQTLSTSALHIASTSESLNEKESAAPANKQVDSAAEKKKLYGGMTQVQFFHRLMDCTRKYQLSSKLKAALESMPLLQMKWSHQEAPAILTCLVLLNRTDDAIKYARRWAGHLPVLRHFMIQAARTHCPELALALLSITAQTHPRAIDTFFYSCAIGACARGPLPFVASAHDLFWDMQDHRVPASEMTYGAVLIACGRLDDWRRAEEFCTVLDAEPERDAIYNSVIQQIGLFNNHEFTVRLFERALTHDIPLSERAHRVAISSCAKISRRDHALSLLDAFLDKIPTSSYSPLLFNSLISSYANLEPATSFDLFETMPQRDRDLFTYNSVLLACVHDRNLSRGLDLFRAMPMPYDVVTVCTMLQLCRTTKDVVRATEIYDEALVALGGPSTVLFEEYVETLVECDAYEAARVFYGANKDADAFHRTSKLLNLLLRASVHDLASAQAIFKDFAARPVPIASVSWNHLLAAHIAADDLANAEELLLRMQIRKSVTVFSYLQLMRAYYNKREFSNVTRVYDHFVSQRFHRTDFGLRNKPLHTPQTGLHILVSRARYAAGDYSAVLDMASSFNAPRLRFLADGAKRELVKQAVLAAEQLGDWQKCVQLYGDMVRNGCSDALAYEATVRAVAKAGEFEAALDVNGGDWYRNSERVSKGWFRDASD